jgi:hypothetical protein
MTQALGPETDKSTPDENPEPDESRSEFRDRIGPTAISVGVHVVLMLLLLLFTYEIEKKQALSLFLKMGDDEVSGGQPMVIDTGIAEPLEMPAVDITRLERIDLDPVLNPEIPRLAISDPEFDRSEISRPAPAVEIEGFGTSQFEGIAETVRGVSVKIGDPQFTLIWDTDADLDLHVIEPGGSHIFWEFRNGKKGGELDVDDTDGHGPENVFWKKGAGPAGEYRWWVHYYGGTGGRVRKSTWKVRIKHDGLIESYSGTLSKIDEKSPERIFVK